MTKMLVSRRFLLGCLSWSFITNTVSGFFFGCSCGDLLPLNPFVFLNVNLTLTCILNESELKKGTTSKDLELSFGSGLVQSDYVSYPNNRTLKYVKNVTSFDEEATYLCSAKGKTLADGTVGTQYLMIDYKPEEITDLECVIYDWDKHMNCSWSLPDFRHLHNVDVALYASNSAGTSYHMCPDMADNKTRCYWNHNKNGQTDYIPVDVVVWSMFFNVTYAPAGVSIVTDVQMIYPEKIVQPAPVEQFDVTSVKSSCVSLHWDVRKYREQIFRITYTDAGIRKVYETSVNANEATVCGLRPSTRYTFNIARKPPMEGYWSDETSVSTVTTPDTDRDNEEMYIIIGATSGGILLLILLVIAGVCLWRRRRNKCDLHEVPGGASFKSPTVSYSAT